MLDQLKIKTPKPDSENAKLLAKSITSDPILIRVEVISEEKYLANNCFYNVQDKIKRCSGEIVYGWQIWEHKFFIEAEFHAVWKNRNTLIDITSKEESEILFFEDKKRKFKGFNIDNIRLNFSGNPIVDDYIKANEILFMIENYGENRFLHDSTKPTILNIPKSLVLIRRTLIENIIPSLSKFILLGGTQDSICFCGRNLPYHSCHSSDIKETYENIKIEYDKNIVFK